MTLHHVTSGPQGKSLPLLFTLYVSGAPEQNQSILANERLANRINTNRFTNPVN